MLLFLPNFKIDAWRKNPVESTRFFPEILCSRTVYQGVPPRSDHHLRTDARASPPPRKPGRGQRPTGAGEGIQLPRAEEEPERTRHCANSEATQQLHATPARAHRAPGRGHSRRKAGGAGDSRAASEAPPGSQNTERRRHRAGRGAQRSEHRKPKSP